MRSIHDLTIDPTEPLDDTRCLLGAVDDRPIASRERVPIVILGPPRSGKTFGVLAPLVRAHSARAVIGSVRNDLIDLTHDLRRRMGTTVVYDADGSVPARYPRSGWNILDGCDHPDVAVTRANQLVLDGVTRFGVTDSAFWETLAARLFAVHLYATEIAGVPLHTMLRDIHAGTLLHATQTVDVTDNATMRAVIDGFHALDSRTLSNVYATLWQSLAVFDRTNVVHASDHGEIDVDVFLHSPHSDSIYLAVPSHRQRTLQPLISAFVAHVVNRHFERDQDNAARGTLLLALDEVGNLAHLHRLDHYTTTAAGSGLQLVTVWHDFSQIVTHFGPSRAHTIVNNSPVRLFLPGLCDEYSIDLAVRLIGDDRFPGSDVSVRRGLATLERGQALLCYSGYEATVIDVAATYLTRHPEIAVRLDTDDDEVAA